MSFDVWYFSDFFAWKVLFFMTGTAWKVIIFETDAGPYTGILKKVLIFRDSHEPPTDLLDVLIGTICNMTVEWIFDHLLLLFGLLYFRVQKRVANIPVLGILILVLFYWLKECCCWSKCDVEIEIKRVFL